MYMSFAWESDSVSDDCIWVSSEHLNLMNVYEFHLRIWIWWLHISFVWESLTDDLHLSFVWESESDECIWVSSENLNLMWWLHLSFVWDSESDECIWVSSENLNLMIAYKFRLRIFNWWLASEFRLRICICWFAYDFHLRIWWLSSENLNLMIASENLYLLGCLWLSSENLHLMIASENLHLLACIWELTSYIWLPFRIFASLKTQWIIKFRWNKLYILL